MLISFLIFYFSWIWPTLLKGSVSIYLILGWKCFHFVIHYLRKNPSITINNEYVSMQTLSDGVKHLRPVSLVPALKLSSQFRLAAFLSIEFDLTSRDFNARVGELKTPSACVVWKPNRRAQTQEFRAWAYLPITCPGFLKLLQWAPQLEICILTLMRQRETKAALLGIMQSFYILGKWLR